MRRGEVRLLVGEAGLGERRGDHWRRLGPRWRLLGEGDAPSAAVHRRRRQRLALRRSPHVYGRSKDRIERVAWGFRGRAPLGPQPLGEGRRRWHRGRRGFGRRQWAGQLRWSRELRPNGAGG